MSRTSERRARRAAEQRRKQQTHFLENRNVWIAGGVALLVIVAAIVGLTLLNQGNRLTVAAGSTSTPGAATPGPVEIGKEVAVPSMGANHIAVSAPHAPYNSTPPTSGPHYDTPAPWGRATAPIAEETWVHNLEHGGIVALYNCPEGCPELVSRLETLLKTGPRSRYGYVKLLLVPYNKTPNRLTLVAWQHYLPLNDYDDAAVRNFIIKYQDHGPEDAP